MLSEYNVCGIDYGLFSVYTERNGRIYFPEWLLPAFELYVKDEDIIQENNNQLSIPSIPDTLSCFLSFYHAQIWYPELEAIGLTPVSKLYVLNEAEIDNITNKGKLTNEFRSLVQKDNPGKCFYRLNSLSSKYEGYLNLDDAIYHMSKSDRILSTFKNFKSPYKHYLFVRKWIDMNNYIQYRCFILNNKLRGISLYDECTLQQPFPKEKLIEFIYSVMRQLDFYSDFTIDIAIHINKKDDMFVIEVNSPVYGIAGSANFTVSEISECLMKDCEGIEYPMIKLH